MADRSYGEVGALRIDGGARLRRTLKSAGVDLADLRDLNRQVGNVIRPTATSNAPVGPDAGGHISSTIRVTATNRTAFIRVGNKRFPYAGPLHWGWFKRGIKPNPWLSQAAQSTEPRWQEIYWRGLNSILDNIQGA